MGQYLSVGTLCIFGDSFCHSETLSVTGDRVSHWRQCQIMLYNSAVDPIKLCTSNLQKTNINLNRDINMTFLFYLPKKCNVKRINKWLCSTIFYHKLCKTKKTSTQKCYPPALEYPYWKLYLKLENKSYSLWTIFFLFWMRYFEINCSWTKWVGDKQFIKLFVWISQPIIGRYISWLSPTNASIWSSNKVV